MRRTPSRGDQREGAASMAGGSKLDDRWSVLKGRLGWVQNGCYMVHYGGVFSILKFGRQIRDKLFVFFAMCGS